MLKHNILAFEKAGELIILFTKTLNAEEFNASFSLDCSIVINFYRSIDAFSALDRSKFFSKLFDSDGVMWLKIIIGLSRKN